MRRPAPYERRIDAGILAGMIVPPPGFELEEDADAPLSRDPSASARLRRREPDDEGGEQRGGELERALRNLDCDRPGASPAG